MGKVLLRFKRADLIKTIVASLLNKFDFFMIIEGNTGTGKSTLAIHIARGVKAEFKRLYALNPKTVDYYYEKVIKKQKLTPKEFVDRIVELRDANAYMFNPFKDIIYNQDDLMNALSSWNRVTIPDEMINISFNRDFQSEKQKNIIKMINMFRDHSNLTIACVPLFNTLDVQIKNLCKMRISVLKRGMGLIQTPNKIIYAKDKWDSANNEKVERDWLVKGSFKPALAKLTTARGIIIFPQLPTDVEKLYQQIKNDKRGVILSSEMGIKTANDEPTDPIDKFVQRLIDGGIKNATAFEGLSVATGIPTTSLKNRVTKKLEKMGKAHQLSVYYWDKKNKTKQDDVIGLV